jgi:MFS family permease
VRPGRPLAIALAGYALGLLVIDLTLGRLPTALVFVLAFLTGLLGPAIAGGWTAQLPSVVEPGRLTRASTLDSTTFTVASLAGPAVAGLIASAFGVTWAALTTVLLFLLAVPAAWSLPGRNRPEPVRHTGIGTDLLAGARAIVVNRALLRVTTTSVVSYFGVGMLMVACPLLGRNLLGASARGALLLSVLAIGALGAKAVLAAWPPRVRPDTIVLLSTLVFTVALFLLAIATSAMAAFGVMVLAGLADGPQLTALLAVRHREAPERLRNQIFTTAASIKITAMALGTAVAGALSGHGVRTLLMVAAAIELLAAVSYLVVRVPRDRQSLSGSPAIVRS